MYVLKDVYPEQEEIDLNSSLGDFVDDHHGEYHSEDHRHEC
jgi:hypothetical protein